MSSMHGGEAYSDTEATYDERNTRTGVSFAAPKLQRFSSAGNVESLYRGARTSDITFTDDEDEAGRGLQNEFGNNALYGNVKIVKTGRQRKKLASRSKGSEFQTRRRKKRVYFCCISSDIDVQALCDRFIGDAKWTGWKYQLYNEVLHLYKVGPEDDVLARQGSEKLHSLSVDYDEVVVDPNFRIYATGAKEVFVFDFGAAVFWGFSRGEEAPFLELFRAFVTKGFVSEEEFPSGEDDMAFISSPDATTITIANDVIKLPDYVLPQQRLSVSFAIAQSSVLAIFESRIDKKIEEYKYIPETLALHGKVHLSERALGQMIGSVFVIRHDVNLHTEILDLPDFFWRQEKQLEEDYTMVMGYLEMKQRTDILNTRLDMLRELLDVLQQQMENAHAVKLEWIVIYLIVVECVIQALAVINKD